MSTETITVQLRTHQSRVVDVDWPFAELVDEFHRWVEIFEVEFNLQLPASPVLQFDFIRRRAAATYAWFRNAVGTRDNITFNIRWLHLQPDQLLAILLHELLHLAQHYHGTPGKRNYHNKQFQAMAQACGLIVTAEGCNVGITEVFTAVLKKHGVPAEPFHLARSRLRVAATQPTKMKKWCCTCTTVRCATKLAAVCQTCEQPFRKAEHLGEAK